MNERDYNENALQAVANAESATELSRGNDLILIAQTWRWLAHQARWQDDLMTAIGQRT